MADAGPKLAVATPAAAEPANNNGQHVELVAEKLESLKRRGNEALQSGNVGGAAAFYTEAIELDDASALLPVLYSNRSMAHIKAESYGLAIADAEQAIRLDPTYIKAYYRRGSANFALGKYKLALRDFKAVCKLRPSDRDARSKLKECEKAVKQMAFADAIVAGGGEEASTSVDASSIAVEDAYDGPRLDSAEAITDEFVKAVMERFRDQKLLHRKYVVMALLKLRDLLGAEPSLVDLSLPAGSRKYTVCGDVHGQYYDLLRIFELNGLPSPQNPYVFNGDFVDRGSFSLEVVMTLFLWKLVYPHGVHLNRGNHETKNMTKIYGFEGEVRHKFDPAVLSLFHECFCRLPLAACLANKVFVVHGGLSSDEYVTLDQIRRISRVCEPADSGLMCDLLWSDPQAKPGRSPSKRGVGLSFGPDITKRFLEHNNLNLVIRSHEVRDNGYEVEHDGNLITVFSAPNYCLPTDAQVLADAGFVGLDQIFAHWRRPDFKVAGYDPISQTLVWERPSALILNRSAARDDLVELGGPGGLRVTSDHDAYVGADRTTTQGCFVKRRAGDIVGLEVRCRGAPANGVRQPAPGRRRGRLEAYGERLREERGKARLPDWVWTLDADQCRAVLAGLGRELEVASPDARDDLVRLALCAGASATFVATAAGWRLRFCADRTDLPPALARRAPPYLGRTWCLSMPSGFLWARRVASRDADKSVNQASQPILIGNCDAMGNKGAFVILDENLHPSFTTFDAAPHPPVRPMAYASPIFGL